MNRRSMMTLGAIALVAGPSAAIAEPLTRFSPVIDGTGSFDHAAFERLLRRYLRAAPDGVNRVDYRAWKASAQDLAALQAYLRQTQVQDPRTLIHGEQFAYWANLYNAETLRIVLAAYPVKSILAIRPTLLSIGPWKAPTLTVADTPLSLDAIESRILRPLFRDARVHYALNCASVSCPTLNPAPWRGATLEADLEASAQAYVNRPRGVRLAPQGLRLSSIYKWYRTDFGGSDAAILAHLRRYARPLLRDGLSANSKIVGYDYDWSLNDIASAER